MKVHLIKKRTIEQFILVNAQSRASFRDWLNKIKGADWSGPADIQKMFGTADLLSKSSNRVVFDIAGNAYRMICKYAFGERFARLYICWIGTHAQYDQLNKLGEQYTVFIY
jgi:mRNA interferase HigB